MKHSTKAFFLSAQIKVGPILFRGKNLYYCFCQPLNISLQLIFLGRPRKNSSHLCSLGGGGPGGCLAYLMKYSIMGGKISL